MMYADVYEAIRGYVVNNEGIEMKLCDIWVWCGLLDREAS